MRPNRLDEAAGYNCSDYSLTKPDTEWILRHHVTPLALKAMKEIQKRDLPAVDRAAIQSDFSVLGRFLVTRQEADIASFKTPSLRNVLVTAPYFHDGSMETLWDAVDHYNKGAGLKDPWLDDDIEPLALTEDEVDDLVAFMASLTSQEYKEIRIKELARQRALARTSRPQRDTARAFGPKPARPKAENLLQDSPHPSAPYETRWLSRMTREKAAPSSTAAKPPAPATSQ